MNRDQQRRQVLAQSGWADGEESHLTGDASGRSYVRLSRNDGTSAILMDAPPEAGESTGPFVRVARHLTSLDLSAPNILGWDENAGFVLLEDLGDAVFARRMEQDSTETPKLYKAAADCLAALHEVPAPEWLPRIGANELAGALDLTIAWYAPASGAKPDPGSVARLRGLMRKALAAIPDASDVLVMRDYHAENLIWLPDRDGVANVGLLDFQDAFAGHPAYDLVSLLEDARRDVDPSLRDEIIDSYAERRTLDASSFQYACAAIGAQRHLRILGVFARLAILHGKRRYLEFLPRVWRYLMADLAHPALEEISDFIRATLPEPGPEVIERLEHAIIAPSSVMLFGAGLGTRMKPLTESRPKPLIEVAGSTLLDHALDLTAEARIATRVVNTHYLGGMIAAHLGARPDIRLSPEAPRVLDTGGGLRSALPLLGTRGPVFTMNTDAVWTGRNPFEQLDEVWDPDRMDALLLLVRPELARGHLGSGDFTVAPDGRLTRGPGGVYSGAQILCTQELDQIDAQVFSLNILWNRMLARDRVFGVFHDGQWCDVGRPNGIGVAQDMLAEAAL